MLLVLRQWIKRLGSFLRAEGHEEVEVWTIDARRMGFGERMREFWRFRRIFWFFAVRMLMKRYSGTVFGRLWLFIQPALPIIIMTFVFGRMLGVASEGVPYFMFFLVGMTAWMTFDRSLLGVTRSLESNRNLIKKVYFPRLIIPFSSVSLALSQSGVYLLMLFGGWLYFLWQDGKSYVHFGPELLVTVFAGAMTVLFAVAVGLWTCVWQTRYRDVRYGLRYFMQFWLYLTPVMYPSSTIPESFQWFLWINPMAPLVEAFKWGILGIGSLNPAGLLTATIATLVVLVGGVWYFGRAEALSVDSL
jgi:lipopolysaccharide transport system permease protein